MVDPSPFNLTISYWNQSLRRVLQIDLPSCSTCSYSCKGMIMYVEMHALADIIISGWPNDIKEVPCPLYPYRQHCELLTVENGLVFHGEALLIPPSERSLVLCTNHIKALPKHSCLPVVVSSGLVSTRPMRKLFGNVKHA